MSIQDQLHASRAEQRKLRLLEAEREIAAEEAEALKMTEEQRQTLLQSFKSVKAEFADLDGLRWTQTALRKFQVPQRRPIHVPGSAIPNGFSCSSLNPTATTSSNNKTFVVLTNADLASFSGEDTIRLPSSQATSRPTLSSPLLSLSNLSSSPKIKITKKTLAPHQSSVESPPYRHRDGSRTRSPVKGLFVYADGDDFNDQETRIETVGASPLPVPSPITRHVEDFLPTPIPMATSTFTRGRMGNGCGPPGLSPAPTYTYAAGSASSCPTDSGPRVETGTVSKGLDNGFEVGPVSSSTLSMPTTNTSLMPQPHRDAPSPPMHAHSSRFTSAPHRKSPLSAPPLTLTESTLFSPDSSSDLLQYNPSPRQHPSIRRHDVYAHSQPTLHPQRSPRSRLHALLHDERGRAAFPFPAPPPIVITDLTHSKSQSVSKPSHVTLFDCPTASAPPKVDLSGVHFVVDHDDDSGADITESGYIYDPYEDDDETPMPSPTTEHRNLDTGVSGGGLTSGKERRRP